MDKLSNHISYKEATYSTTAIRLGISNIPDADQLCNMKLLAKMVFEPTRIELSTPIHVSSMFRSPELNKAIQGAKNSQHLALNGAAMDIDADFYGIVTNIDVFTYIKDNLVFDQLIIEDLTKGHAGWVHVSYKPKDNRNEVLIMYRDELGKTKYLPYTKDNFNNLYK